VRTCISHNDTGTWINLYRNKKKNKTENNGGLSIWFYVHEYIKIIWFVTREINSWMFSVGIVFFLYMLIYLERIESTYSKYVQFTLIILAFKLIVSNLGNLLWNVLLHIKIKYAAQQIIRFNWPFQVVLVISYCRITIWQWFSCGICWYKQTTYLILNLTEKT